VLGRSLAKEPEQRFASCGALVAAADCALGLGKTGPSRRRRTVLLAGAVCLAIAVSFGLIETFGRSPLHRPAPSLFANVNTLARIDPTTNKVSAVIPVGKDPVITAAGGNTVWVYSFGSGIWQIDAATNRVVDTTPMPFLPTARCCGLFTGPVLAANASGAWFIEGGFAGTKPLLVHVPVGRHGQRDYPLPLSPTGVAVGGGAVWVVGHDPRGDNVLRINPTDGRVSETFHFPASARIDSIAFGYRAAWVASSARADLYKIDPRSRQVKSLHVAQPQATRPEVIPRIRKIYVRVTSGGGRVFTIDPSSLEVVRVEQDGPPGNFENEGQFGSLWWYAANAGDVERQDGPGGPISDTIRVTRAPVLGGGPCLTSITTGARSLWVTASPSSPGAVCTR
jgi:hypothetical protein